MNKKYFFYEDDPKLQKILDELKEQRTLSKTIHSMLSNGLGNELHRRTKELEKLSKLVRKKK